MFKRDIKYEDFDGNQAVETAYFNLTKMEIVELQVGPAEGLEALLTRIIKEQDNKTLFELFQKIILMSYGIRSEDGKRFIKTQEIKDGFAQTAAYDALLTELMFDENKLAEFIKAVVPKDIAKMAEDAEKQASALILPPPPPA